MGATTKISWTDATWNPVTGCTPISPGCANCYARTFLNRFRGVKGHKFEHGFDVRLHPDCLEEPLHWRKPKRVFVCSVSDLFHEDVPDSFLDDVWGVMAKASHHTFMVLTKRPARMLAYVRGWWQQGMDHIWLGVTVENQKAADERIPLLLQTPAAVRFLSCEPLLEPVDIGMSVATCDCCERWPSRWVRITRPVGPDLPWLVQDRNCVADAGIYRASSNKHGALSVSTLGGSIGIKPAEFECLPGADWVIIGGESGPHARPCPWHTHIRPIVRQCQDAGVRVFVKQLGTHTARGMGWKHPKGGDPAEWPEDLRVQEFPQ